MAAIINEIFIVIFEYFFDTDIVNKDKPNERNE